MIRPLRKDLISTLKRFGLVRKFEKQILLFQNNPRYPSLHTEILEPKRLKIYSFRIDRKYRAIFIYLGKNTIEPIAKLIGSCNRRYYGCKTKITRRRNWVTAPYEFLFLADNLSCFSPNGDLQWVH